MTDGVNTYTYDAEGNLIGVSGGTSATFTFDALNQRVLTVIGGTTRAYGFNLAGQRATVWDGSGNLISAQYYAGGQPFAYYLAADGHVRFQHQDWLGTERFRTTYTGTVEGSFTSLPFGDSTSTASGSDTDAYHYAGTDADTTDLQHATFRQYSAIQGRWLRPDPYDGSYDQFNPQSLNRYAYVLGVPLSLFDPTGLNYIDPDGNLCDTWIDQDEDGNFRSNVFCAGGGGGGYVYLSSNVGGAGATSSQAPSNQPSVSHCLGQAASDGRGLALGADIVGDVATGFAIANPASSAAILVGLAATSVGTLNAINHFSWSGGAVAGVNQTVASTGVLTHGLEIGSFIRAGTAFSKGLTAAGIFGSVVSTVSDATAAISAYRTCRAGG